MSGRVLGRSFPGAVTLGAAKRPPPFALWAADLPESGADVASPHGGGVRNFPLDLFLNK